MRWIFRLCFTAPFFYWVYLGLMGQLGAEPVSELNKRSGLVSLLLISFGLLVGVFVVFMRHFSKYPFLRKIMLFLNREKRFLGVTSFFYIILHFVLYLLKEGLAPQAFEQMLTKRYLNFASIALIVLCLLAATSFDTAIRILKPKRWKNLHRLIYFAYAMIMAHIFLIEKADILLFAMITFPVAVLEVLRFGLYLAKRS